MKIRLVSSVIPRTGKPAFNLVDENGVMLPGQRDLKIDQPLDGTTTVTVTFVVTGDFSIDLTSGGE